MGNTSSGYVDTYSLNSSTGLFSCTLNYKSIGGTQTVTIDLIPIKNIWGLKSPNNPTQMIIMSRDNKYIFIKNENIDNALPELYSILYPLIKYQIPIPSGQTYAIIILYMASTIEPKDDGTYSKLPEDTDKNKNLKVLYKLYLFCKNPPPELLSDIPDKNELTNFSLIFKSKYDLGVKADIFKFCVNIDVPLQDSFKKIDCKNVTNGSSLIIPTYDSSDTWSILSNPWVIGGLICCCLLLICLSGFAALTMSSKDSTPKYRRRR
jgi:hypothetical protein